MGGDEIYYKTQFFFLILCAKSKRKFFSQGKHFFLKSLVYVCAPTQYSMGVHLHVPAEIIKWLPCFFKIPFYHYSIRTTQQKVFNKNLLVEF